MSTSSRNSAIFQPLTAEQIAWVAGFLEGEGYFELKKQGKSAPTMRIGAGQVNKEPLERLQILFGGRIHKRTQDPSVRRSWWGWELNGRDACLRLTLLIEPWLSENRKERIPWLPVT